jgi:glyoxylase-like metal-dependent hydrolase (beta-lactamase superfamily II)
MTMADSKLNVGGVEVVSLTDCEGDFPLPLGDLFPGVSSEKWAPYRERFPEMFNGPDIWRNHFGCYLLRSEGQTILVDTGSGSLATSPGMVNGMAGGVEGRLLEALAEAGASPEDVDTVFFTHLHPDHVGWNLTPGDSPGPAFPRARYVAHQADWDAFRDPEIQAAIPFPYWEETLAPLEKLGVLDLIPDEHALTGEITAIPTPGHSPGHMGVAIESAGQRALITGDVIVHPAQMTETGWAFGFDMDPERAVETRRHLLDRAEAEGATLAVCHFPAPGFGKLVRESESRYWQAL